MLAGSPRLKPTLTVAVMALASAPLSTYVQGPSETEAFGVPVLPGVYFGLVIAFATYLWAGRDVLGTAIALIGTVIAWIAAAKLSIHIYTTIDSEIQDAISAIERAPLSPQPLKLPLSLDYLVGLCGIVGGFVGSAITVLGVAVTAKPMRNVSRWAPTILIGTVLGALLEFYASKSDTDPVLKALHIGSLLPLYVGWQMAVAASITHGLSSEV
jgi:hypothetical protein